MKRKLIWFGLVILLVALAGAAAIGSVLLGRKPVVDGQEVRGVRIVADGFSSVALIPGGEKEVILIDAGNDKAGKAILAELTRRRLGPQSVVAIFLTHGHADHRGAIPLFPQARVFALAAEVPVIEGRATGGGPLNRLFGVSPSGVKVTRIVQDGETVEVGNRRVRAFAVPGHTPGSAAYLADGVLFLGDAADASSDGVLTKSAWVFSNSQSEDVASLKRLSQRLAQENLDVKAMVFAHSGPLEDGLARLKEFAGRE
jgi:hydroxyacylglutathione hydrolase